MIISPHAQRTPEWHADRIGMLTTSEFDKILTPAKLEISKQLDEYLAFKAAEWWAGRPLKRFDGSFATERGSEVEPEGRDAFRVSTGYHCAEVGFIRRAEDDVFGASLDSLVCDQEPDATRPAYYACGTHELKCPLNPWIHAMYTREVEENGTMPREHHMQVQGHLWVTGLPRAWFQSYYPDAPDCIIEVAPDPRTQDALNECMPEVRRRLLEWRAWWTDHGCTPRDPAEWVAEQAGVWEGAA